MSAMMYWRERLIEKQPFFDEGLRLEGVTYKISRKDPGDVWPHSIRRNTLYQDYCQWHEKVYLKPYRESGYYSEMPEHLPKALNESEFFAITAPWLYVVGRKEQVRTYPIKVKKLFENELYDVVQKHYFIRLCYWEQHIAAFELQTGMSLGMAVSYFQPNQAIKVVKAIRDYTEELTKAKSLFGNGASR